MFKYLRVRLFQALLGPFSHHTRRKRGELFVATMKPVPGEKVLDVGGQPQIWDHVKVPLEITCLNLAGIMTTEHQSHHKFIFVEGDGCDMPQFQPGQFDMVFSNSVIEHVGDESKRAMFAREIRRISNRYWVQTPYKHYPIEAHSGMPFWWLYPEFIRKAILRRWKKKLPAWTEMIEHTTVISTSELKALFPESKVRLEWMIFPKSLIAYSNRQSHER